GRERVAEVAPIVLGRPTGRVHHFCTETLRAETRVVVGVSSAQSVVHVQRRDAIAERRQHMPEARRVGAARDEAGHGPTRRDQLLLPNELLDAVSQHTHRVDTEGFQVFGPGPIISLWGRSSRHGADARRNNRRPRGRKSKRRPATRWRTFQTCSVSRRAARSTRCSRDGTKRSRAPSRTSTSYSSRT